MISSSQLTFRVFSFLSIMVSRKASRFLAYRLEAFTGTSPARLVGPRIVTPFCVDGLIRLGELAVAAALGGEVDDHGARLHALHHCRRDEPWRRPARDQRCRDDDVLRLDVVCHQFGLFPLVLRRHGLGVTRSRLRLLEFLVLHGDELGAEGGNLLLRRRPHVRGRDDGTQPLRGGDRLQARHANYYSCFISK